VSPEQHLWAESYERDLRDIFSLQSEVARAIAQEIKVELTAQERTLLTRARPVNPRAHEASLRGIYHVQRASEGDIKTAISYFQKALEIVPSYAGGYKGLTMANGLIAVNGFSPPADAISAAEAAALKAVELDDMDAQAHF